MSAQKKGFTLIELMITISIVAIISAIGLVSYSQTQKIARDARRKEDLRSLAIAIELYYQKIKTYPPVLASLKPNYINNIPTDPKDKLPYPYSLQSGYTLCATLENVNDPDPGNSGGNFCLYP